MLLEDKNAMDIVKSFMLEFLDPTGKGFLNVAQQTNNFLHPYFLTGGRMKMNGGGDKLAFSLMLRHTDTRGSRSWPAAA